jgi:peptidoglycan/LPS O-acetylase OafA/YrhL
MAGACACLSYIALAFTYDTLDLTVNWGIVRCLAGFLFGFLLFRFAHVFRLAHSRRLVRLLELAVSMGILLTLALSTGPYVVIAIPLFVVLVALLQTDAGPIAFLLSLRLPQFLGRISYSIYMVHSIVLIIVIVFLQRLLPMLGLAGTINPWVGDAIVVIALVSVMAVACGTYSIIEEPGRLFGKTHFPVSNRAAPVPS